jgi:hypothetical protein
MPLKRTLKLVKRLSHPQQTRNKLPTLQVRSKRRSSARTPPQEFDRGAELGSEARVKRERGKPGDQFYIPGIHLGKTKTDMCKEFMTISLWLKNPDLSAEEYEDEASSSPERSQQTETWDVWVHHSSQEEVGSK